MKYTLITGASGFIGANLIKLYPTKELKILIKDKNFQCKGVKKININISKKKINFNFLKDVKTVIHLALIDNKSSKKKIKQKNYTFIKNLFEQSKKYNVQKIIKISTAKVYGLNPNKKITEKSKLKPFNDYVRYHAESDQFLYRNINKSNLDIIILRISNGFGAPKTFQSNCWDLIVNNFCYNAFTKNKIIIKSNLNIKKNFIDMKKIIKTIKFFSDNKKKINGIFNVGGEKNFSLKQIALIIKKSLKSKDIKILSTTRREIENKNFTYNIDKIKKLKCKIKDNFDQELKETFNFLKKNKKNV
tara:strand:+ start:378 stop:1286 length:909 start_codon:yes stop_codon:yes gene_type:complete